MVNSVTSTNVAIGIQQPMSPSHQALTGSNRSTFPDFPRFSKHIPALDKFESRHPSSIAHLSSTTFTCMPIAIVPFVNVGTDTSPMYRRSMSTKIQGNQLDDLSADA